MLKHIRRLLLLLASLATKLSFATLPVIMVTGYWPPTNEMLRPWSTDPIKNPSGWQGANWEGRGYDVKAYFPEFDAWPHERVGTGDFAVDYKSVQSDFERLTTQLEPVAILSFGLGNGPWEVETHFPNYWPAQWPDDHSVGQSTLPAQAIIDAVNGDKHLHVRAWIDKKGDAGNFLCGYLGRTETLYQSLHSRPSDPAHVGSAGFIHVGDISPKAARQAFVLTLRALIGSLRASSTPERLNLPKFD